jgi:muramoyltetrapeptide carboxypeptidase
VASVSILLKPHAVSSDAQVAVVSMASKPKAERVELGLAALRSMGYTPQSAEHILTRGPLGFAGTPEMRLSDLHHAFADDQVRAIFSTRGGYGSNYLLDGLDLDLIAESVKPFIGYSDLTAVHTWLRLLFTVRCSRQILRAKTAYILPVCRQRLAVGPILSEHKRGCAP